MIIRTEKMSDFFIKHHIEGLPFSAVLHQFTAPDEGDPHDHPFGFRSFILRGGYVEEIYHLNGKVTRRVNSVGDSLWFEPSHIHRIIRLMGKECWTLILPTEAVRKPGFYQFQEDGVYHRFWDQKEFTLLRKKDELGL